MRIAGFLALHWEKIGTKLYGYVLAKSYTSSVGEQEGIWCATLANRGILASGEQGAPVAFTFVCECRFCRASSAR